jgi:PAS domain S-box-containing protein
MRISAGQLWNERPSAIDALLCNPGSMFRMLFEHSADAIFLFDPLKQVFVDCNQAAVQMMRASSKEQLLMVNPADLSPQFQPDGRASREKAQEMTVLALASGSHRFEWSARRFDGVEFPMEVLTTPIQSGDYPLLATVCRDISERKRAEREILRLNASLEQRVAKRTTELMRSNDQLRRAQLELRQRSERVQKHRDVLLDLAQLNKSDFRAALQRICSLAASTLDLARVGYWSLSADGGAIVCQMLHLRPAPGGVEESPSLQLSALDAPEYFAALSAHRPIVAHNALTHQATRGLAESYLKPLGISSMLDAPVWLLGAVVGVLCHEHVGPARDWLPEEIDFVSALGAMVSLSLEESNRARSERALRESEEKFRALFEASSQGVILHNEQEILEVNPAALRILGVERGEELIGRHPAELSTPIQPGGQPAGLLVRQHIEECMSRGNARFDWMVRNSRSEDVPIEVILTRIQWGGCQIIQSVFNSIAERKRAEAEMNKTLAREKELGQLRSTFVSMVSHEFRTPLGIIQSSAEILGDYLDQLPPAERSEHLQSIQKNTRRMAGLMEEVLLISRFDAGKMEFKPARLDFPSFLRRLVDEVLSATQRRCPVELALDEMPPAIEAEEGMLRHIFTNLLTNAIKYSEPGSPVRFEARREGSEIVARISDRGIGIPEPDREWLFSAFHRGRNVGDRPGTGLGLVIVKRCLDLHYGKISVQSRVGHGTTVTVRLPQLRHREARRRN